MPAVMDLWNRLANRPLGKHLFSLMFAQKAPYFATVRPRFNQLRPHYAELVVRDRRGVRNHILGVHAIALCNGLEAAMGALAEVTIPASKRWIPMGMQVAYTAKAQGDITCFASTTQEQWDALPSDAGGELAVRVRGVDRAETTVIEGEINLWVSPKRTRTE